MLALSCLALPAQADMSMPTYPFEDQPAAAAKPAKPKAAKPGPAAPKHAAPVSAPVKAEELPLPTPRPHIAALQPAQPPQAKTEPPKIEAPQTEPAKVEPKKADAAKLASLKSDIAPPSSGVFAGTSFGERHKIQSALLWAGDVTGSVSGEDPMLTAIKNFQKRIKAKVTGVLTPEERARLVAATEDREQEFGWSVVLDPATGIRIGLPTKMVPHTREASRGTRWTSAHGEIQVETFRVNGGTKLADLFEREKKEPGNRKVEHSVLRDDTFFISGMQGLKRFSVRAKVRDGEVRGFTIFYDQAMETIVAPVVVAMASAFTPFPERTAPFAALAMPVEYGNGIVVSARGHIVTGRRLADGCQVIVVQGLGDAERLADDEDAGLALLRVYGPRKVTPLALAGDAPKGGDLTLIGVPDPKEQNGKKLTEIKARLAEGSAIELRQPLPMAGFAGAAALDAQGRFAGLTEMRNAVLASTEPSLPPVRLISTATIRDFLAAHHVDTTQAAAPDAKASLVRIICVRR